MKRQAIIGSLDHLEGRRAHWISRGVANVTEMRPCSVCMPEAYREWKRRSSGPLSVPEDLPNDETSNDDRLLGALR